MSNNDICLDLLNTTEFIAIVVPGGGYHQTEKNPAKEVGATVLMGPKDMGEMGTCQMFNLGAAFTIHTIAPQNALAHTAFGEV